MTTTPTLTTPTANDLYPSRHEPEPRRSERLDPVVWGSADDGPLESATLADYERDGFLILPGMFTPDELRDASDELDRLRADRSLAARDDVIAEPESLEVRSIFAVHQKNEILRRLCLDARVVEVARQLLGGDVSVHQSRVNYKSGFRGKEFYWHSDFETWHVEDGMPRMRAVSCSISLTENTPNNGPLMLIPGSHRTFLSCVGETPEKNFESSLRKQEIGVPDDASLAWMVDEGGIETAVGPVGTVIFFECNTMHGSNSNITPLPRSNCFTVFNSVENALVDPFCGLAPRPEFIAHREDTSPVSPA